MFAEKRKLVPPDGGWGWIVVMGVSVVNLCTRSIEQSFGLLFGDILKDLNVETTGAAVIMGALDALINCSGLFVGPLIRNFSYRKVSLCGALLVGMGLSLTSPAKSMGHILATYSIINGLGVGLTASATFVALNNYFVKKRSQAIGFSLAGTAFGMMLMPQAVRLLLDAYGFRGAILVLGGFALNALVGSVLLQPAKWHFVPEIQSEELGYQQEMETIKETEDEYAESDNLISNKFADPLAKPFEELKPGVMPITRKATFPRNFSSLSFVAPKRRRTSKESVLDSIIGSYSNLDFTGSSIQLQLDDIEKQRLETNAPAQKMRRNMSYPGVQLSSPQKLLKDFQRTAISITKEEPVKEKSAWQKVVEFMDFDLLKDPVYLNLVFGLSLFYVAEQNFKMVMPFFFRSIGYNTREIAFFLSVQAFTDVLARLVLPPFCDRLTIRKRTLFMSAIFLLGICRSVLAQQTEYTNILIWLVIAGFVRGAVLINFAITISEYSTLEKLPAAFGLHNFGKGIFVLSLGPILGKIRDATKSYPYCLHSQTILIMLCCVAWSIEYSVVFYRSRNKRVESDSDTTSST